MAVEEVIVNDDVTHSDMLTMADDGTVSEDADDVTEAANDITAADVTTAVDDDVTIADEVSVVSDATGTVVMITLSFETSRARSTCLRRDGRFALGVVTAVLFAADINGSL